MELDDICGLYISVQTPLYPPNKISTGQIPRPCPRPRIRLKLNPRQVIHATIPMPACPVTPRGGPAAGAAHSYTRRAYGLPVGSVRT